MHDRAAYLKIKADDIGPDCYMFNLSGRCPRGVACRVGAKHLTEEGFNIVDTEKFQDYQRKPLATRNQISKELQDRLRKHKYNFSKAEKVVKANDAFKKRAINEKNKTNDKSTEVNVNGDNPSIIPTPSGEETGQTNGAKIDEAPRSDDTSEKNCCTKTAESAPTISSLDAAKTSEDLAKDSRIGPVPDDDLIALRPLEKKRIDWRDKILLSPLTTVGNLPFRRICKEYGADITCGEMALAPKILKGAHEEWALVKRHESEDIFGVQVCGNNPGVLARCAQLLNQEAEIDYIDLNLGCPIDLIYKQGGGSGMLNRLNVLETVVKSMNDVLHVPLTIKTRMGVYMDKPVAHNLVSKFRDWGASMITVCGTSTNRTNQD